VAQFRKLYNTLEVKEGEWEPMLNLLAWTVKEGDAVKYIALVYLREKHRPSHYFAEGDANILLSPASVDMGGVFITPLEKDFNKITEKELTEIVDELQISSEAFGMVKNALREQPTVSVGIMSEKEIAFELNNVYTFSTPGCDCTCEVKGPQTAVESNGKVLWNGKEYTELMFTPKGIGTFWLRGVTIGVNFHWERKEDQKFGSALRIIVEHGKLTAVNVNGVEEQKVFLLFVFLAPLENARTRPYSEVSTVINLSASPILCSRITRPDAVIFVNLFQLRFFCGIHTSAIKKVITHPAIFAEIFP
jgi:hypothetical protein